MLGNKRLDMKAKVNYKISDVTDLQEKLITKQTLPHISSIKDNQAIVFWLVNRA